jgi:non-specific serine/threonine protein kinase
MLDGQMSMQKRKDAVKKFNNENEIVVFMLSIKAGGVGLNLTVANHVFLCDPWWNPAVEQQAFDRCYRIGQTKEVNINRLYIGDTVEDRMRALQDKKKKEADAVLSGGDLSHLKKKRHLTQADVEALVGVS